MAMDALETMTQRTPDTPTVLYVTPGLDIGGVETRSLLIAQATRRFPHFKCVFACFRKPGAVGKELQACGFPLYVLPAKPSIPSIPAVLELVRLIRRLQPDIVHTCCIEANVHGVIAARLAGARAVVAEEVGVPVERSQRARLLSSWIWRRADLVLAQSEAAAAYLVKEERAPSTSVHNVSNCVDMESLDAAHLEQCPPRGRQEVIIGCVGRLSREKGHAILLRSFGRILETHRGIRLALVGDGPERERLEQLAEELHIRDHVDFLGQRRDVPRLLTGFDLFVLPSLTEGLPVALLEALTIGVPAVCTSVGGVPEVVQPGRTGILAPPDNPAALAEAITMGLCLTPVARECMRENARKVVAERYSLQVYIKRLSWLYDGILRRSVAAPS